MALSTTTGSASLILLGKTPDHCLNSTVLMRQLRGFAMGWQYAIGWLITLPFEITAAGLTIGYWHEFNIGIWIAVFLFLLIIVQFFGVKGYGEVEFVLGLIKILAVLGFVSPIMTACGTNPLT